MPPATPIQKICKLLLWKLSLPVGSEALSRAEPPAGPPKFDVLVADATFPEISVMFRHHARTYPYWQLFLKRIDEHETYIPE